MTTHYCKKCQKQFCNEHRSDTYSKAAKKCPLCNFRKSLKSQMYTHFKDTHDIEMDVEIFEFSAREDFEIWKTSTEQISKSRFVKERGDLTYKLHKTFSYICHRSGFYISESQNKRHLKTQGSRKIEGFCQSAMKVTYIKTHVGHTIDLGHLNLTAGERKEIAAKIALKIPFSHILDEVRDKVTEDSIQRIHLLTRKDLNNITTAFNLHAESVRHPNDAISIEAWVTDMHNTQCVLFYKPQEDFVLIIMNDGQFQMLQQFSTDCVCIDCTHGLNGYDFELHTLLVLDDLRQGFPTAFLISNRSDQEVLTLFFSCIKEKIGYSISPKVFMSDMAEAHYNVWNRVMNEAEFRLFCTWHVDRAWRKNLSSITSKDKQVNTFLINYFFFFFFFYFNDKLFTISFLLMLEQFLKKSFQDPDTKFSAYFNEHYGENVKSWAYCYRLHSGLYKSLSRTTASNIPNLNSSVDGTLRKKNRDLAEFRKHFIACEEKLKELQEIKQVYKEQLQTQKERNNILKEVVGLLQTQKNVTNS
ncbi:hypothetical protein RI129_002945 [Pyrocoelia pectoralis]|uniref:MULE transposase domain-containing protein n=1 Tax=Pyrocoelia pectoralis TaxID=417401 RepID=A0AAN7ZUD8_9COLE